MKGFITYFNYFQLGDTNIYNFQSSPSIVDTYRELMWLIFPYIWRFLFIFEFNELSMNMQKKAKQ